MRSALWLLLLFGLAVAFVLTARLDQGYVVIVYPPWRVEMSFMLATALAALLFLVAYASVRIVRVALRLPGEVQAWRAGRHKRKADDRLCQAIAALLGGDAAAARELADRVLAGEPPPLTALLAARAALDLGDRAAARDYLAKVKPDAGPLEQARQHLARQASES